MNIERMFYPVTVLGPGKRLGIWTRGCSRGCPGCMSEDLQEKDPACEIPLGAIVAAADEIFNIYSPDGITVSGGEPLEQPEELGQLLRHFSRHTKDILLYTGYTWDEIRASSELKEAAAHAGVLVTGPYADDRNDGRALRGSSNQQIIFQVPELEEKYLPEIEKGRSIQFGQSGRRLFMIGILG